MAIDPVWACILINGKAWHPSTDMIKIDTLLKQIFWFWGVGGGIQREPPADCTAWARWWSSNCLVHLNGLLSLPEKKWPWIFLIGASLKCLWTLISAGWHKRRLMFVHKRPLPKEYPHWGLYFTPHLSGWVGTASEHFGYQGYTCSFSLRVSSALREAEGCGSMKGWVRECHEECNVQSIWTLSQTSIFVILLQVDSVFMGKFLL